MTNIFLCCIRGSSVGSSNNDSAHKSAEQESPYERQAPGASGTEGREETLTSWPNLEQVRDLAVNPVHFYNNMCNTRDETPVYQQTDQKIATLQSRRESGTASAIPNDYYELKTLTNTGDFHTTDRRTLATTGDFYTSGRTATIRRHQQSTLRLTQHSALKTPDTPGTCPRVSDHKSLLLKVQGEDSRKISTPINSGVEVRVPDFDLSQVINLHPPNCSHLSPSPTMVALNVNRHMRENSTKASAVSHVYEQLKDVNGFRTFRPSPIPKIVEPGNFRKVDNYVEVTSSEGFVKVKSFTSTYSSSELQLKPCKSLPDSLVTQVEEMKINERQSAKSQNIYLEKAHGNPEKEIVNNLFPDEDDSIYGKIVARNYAESFEDDSVESGDSHTPVIRDSKSKSRRGPMSQISRKVQSRLDTSLRCPAVLQVASPVPSINRERGLVSMEVSRLAKLKRRASFDWNKLP